MFATYKNGFIYLLLLSLCLVTPARGDPVDIFFTNTPSSLDSSIDPTGNTFVTAAVNNNIEMQIYQNNGTWSQIYFLSSTGMSDKPSVAIDGKGNALVAWFEYNVSGFDVMTSYYSSATKTFSEPVVISQNLLNSATAVQVDFYGDEKAIAFWSASDGTNHFFESAVFSGGSWTESTTTFPQTDAIERFGFGASSQGDGTVFWSSAGDPDLFGASFDGGSGLWSLPEPFSNSLSSQRSFATYALNDSGQGAAFWVSETSKGIYLLVTRLDSGLVIANYFSSTIAIVTNLNSFGNATAISSEGNAFLLWQENSGGKALVKGASFNVLTGQTSSPTTLLESAPTLPSLHLGVDQSGNGVAVWSTLEAGASYLIYEAVYGSGTNSWGNASPQYSTSTPIKNLNFSLNSVGNTAITWTEDASAYLLVSNKPGSPSNLQVEVSTNRFPFQTEYAHTVSWKPSPTQNVVSYKFYIDGNLIATLGSNIHSYTVRNSPPKGAVTYQVVSVSSNGIESLPASITFGGK